MNSQNPDSSQPISPDTEHTMETPMNLDELKAAWTSLEKKVDGVSDSLAQQETAKRSQRWGWIRLRTLASPVVETLIGFVCALLGGSFLGDHFQAVLKNPVTGFPAILVLLGGILAMNLAGRQIYWLIQVDPAASILEAQKMVAKAALLKVVSTKVAFFYGLAFWIAGPIFLIQLAGGPEVALVVHAGWAVGNVLLGAMAGAALWVWGDRAPWSSALKAAALGPALNEAKAYLKEVKEG
jgi:hypothetical protein